MRILLLSIAVLFSSQFIAQERFCGSTEAQNDWFSKNPELKKQFEKLQAEAADRDKTSLNSSQRTMSGPTYTIPVVFHILHQGGAENISDAQVMDAMNILNRDYQKLNPDTTLVVNPFKSLIGDVKFQFTLASKDPGGNCTNGIVRHWDTKTNWMSSTFNYYTYTWNTTRYLNIYVVKTISSGAAGYTYLPGSGIPAVGDAIVILSNYVGSIGSGNSGTSRALTHEVGHWFNLPHTWGGTNQPGVACGDDGVSDTPITKGFSTCNLNNASICNPGIVENIQNYMDYSYCSRMFTNGQATRMQNALNSSISGRNNLSATGNLFITGISDPLYTCKPVFDMNVTSYTVCTGNTLTFKTYTSNANPTIFQWSGSNGAVVTTSSITQALIQFNTAGTSVVTCQLSNANGSTSESITITVLDGLADLNTTTMEGFESGSVPALWNVLNPTTPAVKWEVTSEGAKSGSKSIVIKGEDSPPDFIEILESPSYDFKNNPGAQFYFYYAYARASATNKDMFKVQASKDCGGSWTDVWAPSNGYLASTSGGTTSDILYPTTEWVMYDLVNESPYFVPFTDESNVRLRFYFREDVGGSGYGNRMYLDNINFTTPVGVNEITKAIGLSVYPNPGKGDFNLRFTLANTSKISYKVISVAGSVMMEEEAKTFSEGEHVLSVNAGQRLSKGIYFLNFEMNGVNMSSKLIVE